jgi:hypothetical protein
MKRNVWLLASCLVVGMGSTAMAQTRLPLVDNVDFKSFQDNCRRLLQVLDGGKSPVPEETRKAIQVLLKGGTLKPQASAAQIQKLIDPYCLVAVTINPESRVKVQRGPAAAALDLNRETIALIKIQNQAGVTHALKVASPQFRPKDRPQTGQWLRGSIDRDPPLRKTLSGHAVEYVVLRLLAHEAGKREATLRFDVGQGTQDLGFRGEVPVLFQVRPGKR